MSVEDRGDTAFGDGDAEELALRMGASPGTRAEPMTDVEVAYVDVDAYPEREPGSAVIRVGEDTGWAFAITNQKPLPDPHPHLRLIPADLREEYERATDPDWWQRHTRHLPARAQWSPRA